MSRQFGRFLERVLDEHNERRRLEGERFVARDMVDVLLQLAHDPDLEVPLRRDNVKALTQDLIIGGTDTSWMTIEWAVSELLKNPELLTKATTELDRVVRRDRLVRESDLPHLPYIDCIIKETLRAPGRADAGAAPGPRGRVGGRLRHPRRHDGARERLGHRPRPCPVGRGRGVQAGAVRREQGRCSGGGDGLQVQDAAVRVRLADVPGVHPRLREVTLSLANLLHGFACRLSDGMTEENLCMEETYQLTLPRKVPLEAIVEPKLPAMLYAGA
ncbi:hypothetical protein SEVIR_2G228566v4 [Setaria viridis]|uniref:Cytochrome P450 n=1 Tax=Setaria viridis TaxID=4556 RepID=A0A4U6VWY4_SETVI|nr:hypothetical protein SEVIR_2G228566v2 [Setaria viridis]